MKDKIKDASSVYNQSTDHLKVLTMLALPQYFKIFPAAKEEIGFGFDVIVYGKVAESDQCRPSETQPLAVARVRPWEVSGVMPPDATDQSNLNLMRWESPLNFEACLPALYDAVETGLEAEQNGEWLAGLCKDFMSKHWRAYAMAIEHLKLYCTRNYLIERGMETKPNIFKLRDYYC
jgi:hypothetical protein